MSSTPPIEPRSANQMLLAIAFVFFFGVAVGVALGFVLAR